jgi:hypothetical protein
MKYYPIEKFAHLLVCSSAQKVFYTKIQTNLSCTSLSQSVMAVYPIPLTLKGTMGSLGVTLGGHVCVFEVTIFLNQSCPAFPEDLFISFRFEDAWGDGINVAQRIMSFAEPRQLLVSRSYYDIIFCLLQEYAQLFQYKGAKADKLIHEHDIYSMALKFLPFILSSMSAEVGRNMTYP